jgi:hypothetical protein
MKRKHTCKDFHDHDSRIISRKIESLISRQCKLRQACIEIDVRLNSLRRKLNLLLESKGIIAGVCVSCNKKVFMGQEYWIFDRESKQVICKQCFKNTA